MKKLLFISLAALAAAEAALAHEPAEHGSTAGLFGLKAAYVHVLLNPIPVYGLAISIAVLVAALFLKTRRGQIIGLLFVVVCALCAWPVLHYGQNAYNSLFKTADFETKLLMDQHMERAELLVYAFYAAAVSGALALFLFRKRAKGSRPLTFLTLVLGVGALLSGGWISRSGGKISHLEFRTKPFCAVDAEAPHEKPHHHEKAISQNAQE
jgi:hypothetical protein